MVERQVGTTLARGVASAGTGEECAMLCEVFRSSRREGMYLYVERSEGLARVPEDLMQRFGRPESALVFRLYRERRLARTSARDVLAALEEKGFYLQMPPAIPSAVATARASDDTDREEPSC